jgi:hypothetical protein
MIAMDTVGDVYLHWMVTYVYQSGVELLCDFVKEISGNRMTAFNIYNAQSVREDSMILERRLVGSHIVAA